MTAFTVVRFKAKPGKNEEFEKTFESLDRKFSGLRRFVLIKSKTDDQSYCSIAEWEGSQKIAEARPRMKENLDQMRHLLDHFSEELGVTDPVSGEAILDITTKH